MVKDGARLNVALRELLFKLGVQTARVSPFEDALLHIALAYGTPDQLMMDPKSYKNFVRTFGLKKK